MIFIHFFLVEATPTITSCSAVMQNWYQGKLRNELQVPCRMDDITTNDLVEPVYVGDRDFNVMHFKWSATFSEPQTPPPRPNYVTDYKVGLTSSTTKITLRNGKFIHFVLSIHIISSDIPVNTTIFFNHLSVMQLII